MINLVEVEVHEAGSNPERPLPLGKIAQNETSYPPDAPSRNNGIVT